MLHSRYIVVEDFPDNSTRVLYTGASSIEAQKAMGLSIDKGEADAVLLFSHPMQNQIRYPLREKVEIEERGRQAEKTKTAEADAKKAAAAKMREQAKQLQKQADALEAKAVAHELPAELDEEESEDSADGKPADGKPAKKGKPKKSA